MNYIEAKVLDPRLYEMGLSRGTDGSAGIDLRAMCEGPVDIMPGTTKMIPTGLSVYIRDKYFAGFIMARSGLASKKGLAPANKVGLIDADYQGPLMVALHNHGKIRRTVEVGERIAQLVIMPVVEFKLDFVQAFSNETIRGEGGFGSTGSD